MGRALDWNWTISTINSSESSCVHRKLHRDIRFNLWKSVVTKRKYDGLRGAEIGRNIILHHHLSLRRRGLGDWILSTGFYHCLSSMVGRSCPICHCESRTQERGKMIYERRMAIGVKRWIHREFINVFFGISLFVFSASNLQLCVPDWPFFNRHPVKWLESVPNNRQTSAAKKNS